jgi:hypothetical protein
LVSQHKRALRARSPNSPLIALLDHGENLAQSSVSLQEIHPGSSAHRWDVGQANPDLDPTEFRGIEVFLSTESLLAAEHDGKITLMRPATGTPMGCRNPQKVGIAELLAARQTAADYELFVPMLNYLESQLTDEPMLVV